MKITTLILFLALMQVSAAGIAQRLTLQKQDLSLKQLFNEINRQTDYTVVWSATQVDANQKVSVDFNNTPLLEVLDQALKYTNLDYTIENKTVVVKQKQQTLFDKAKAYFATVTVQGKVTDELGDPMAGATVREKGTKNATITDKNGSYHLTVTDNKALIDFSYVGYETQELAAKDLPDGSTIILKATSQNLHEVVVSKGYYNEKQELSTSSVSVVDAKTIEEQPVADPIQALIGRVPGLNIQQTSGVPGSYATIHINGLNSIANGNDPLYIIDGVPFSSVSLSSPDMNAGAIGSLSGGYAPTGANYNANGSGISPFSALNPDDIENIEVLKDADATSIYGSRGANGVILITTKKGRPGVNKFSVDYNQGIGQVAHFMDLLNTQQYLKMRQEAYATDGLTVPNIITNPSDNNYDVDGLWDQSRYTNWQKVLIGGNATWTNVNGSLSGGNANTQFLLGAGYNHQTTVYPGDYGDTKKSIHVSITNTSDNQKFHAQFSASYVNDDNYIPTGDYTGTALTLAPDAPALYNTDGSLNWQIYQGNATFGNPLANTYNSNTSVTNNLVSSLDLSYRLLPGLTLKSTFGYNHDEMYETQIQTSASFAPPNNTNPYTRSISFATSTSQSWNVEPQLAYKRKIAKGTLDVLLGSTFQQQQAQSLAQYAYGFASDALITDPLAASASGLQGDEYSLYRYNALYSHLGYNWEEKYLFNITARRDGSSRFGPGRQWGNFGAIGLGWIFTKEKFVQDNLPWLNFGKLRGSYGTTGSDQISNYGYLTSYSPNSPTYQGVAQLLPTGLPNATFGWETDKKLEFGLDLGFLKDRIDLSADYYRNRSSNELVAESVAFTTGEANININLPATVQNTGLELQLRTINIKTNDFNWTSNINFTFPDNKLVDFPGLANTPYKNGLVVGQPIAIQKVWQYTGVNPQTGLYTFATQSANGALNTTYDRVVVNPTQKYYGGMQNSLTYKNFSLDIFIQFVQQEGHNWQYYFGNINFPGGANFNVPTAVLSAWQTPGQVTNIERLYGSSNATAQAWTNLLNSNGVITNTSFIKLKNVSLSYKLPAAWQQWAGMQNARFYIQGQNLFTITKYIGLDPETQGLGLPPLRMITAGVSASF